MPIILSASCSRGALHEAFLKWSSRWCRKAWHRGAGRRTGPCAMRRPRAGFAPCVRDALGLPSAPTKWGRPKQRAGRGRTSAGQSPCEQGGPRSRKDRKPSVRAPEATVPGSEIAAVTERRKARVSLSGGRDALRCCREAASETKTLRFAALRPPRCVRGPEEIRAHPAPAKEHGR